MNTTRKPEAREKSPRSPLRAAGDAHDRLIYQRRIRAIADAINPLIPSGTLLDIGCGNGELASYLVSNRADIIAVGLEVLLRLKGEIPIVIYSGGTIPFKDQSVEVVLLADTLHHIENKEFVLAESLRVARHSVVVKDHFYENRWEYLVLKILDIGGNLAHGVPSIFNYYSRSTWEESLISLNAVELHHTQEVPDQYPALFQSLLGKRIQFISQIARSSTKASTLIRK
jgi:ubiquinone/menaquinone biosynthesis C-methylase UbiE